MLINVYDSFNVGIKVYSSVRLENPPVFKPTPCNKLGDITHCVRLLSVFSL